MAKLPQRFPITDMSDTKPPAAETRLRPVRSFVRREGRITDGQRLALQQLWPVYGFTPPAGEGQPVDFNALFGRPAPLVLEIGYGDGEALVEYAGRCPELNLIGAEVYTSGIGHCLMRIEEQALKNVRLCSEDAVELLKYHIDDDSLSEIRLFFPDPWPKKKHHKRRIVNGEFCELLCRKLEVGGRIHFATDWAPYAEWAMEIFESCACLENIAGAGKFLQRPDSRIETKFERRGLRLGQPSQDLIFRRVKSSD